MLAEGLEDLVDLGKSGFFGLVSDGKAGERGVGREFLLSALREEVLGESRKIGLQGGADDRVVRLIGLDDDFGMVEVAATDATDDLSNELKSALFGGKVGEGEPGVSLDDADRGEIGKIKAAGEGLGADEEVDFTAANLIIELIKAVFLIIITVKAGDLGLGKEAGELRFKEFGAKTFVDDAGVTAAGAAGGDFFLMTADVAGEKKTVGMEGHREITGRAEGLPTAFFTDSERGRAATIMKNEGLVPSLDIFCNTCQ